jgi:hypothetical protein
VLGLALTLCLHVCTASKCLCAGRTMYQFQFQIPPYYTLLVRSLSVLEVSRGAHMQQQAIPQSQPAFAHLHLSAEGLPTCLPTCCLPLALPCPAWPLPSAGHCAGLRS